jgi:hypothetical protein
MLTIVDQDNGYAGFHEPLPTKVSVLVIRLLPLPIQLSSAPCRFQLFRKKDFFFRQATNLPFVLVPSKFPLVSESQPINFNYKYSVNNERF